MSKSAPTLLTLERAADLLSISVATLYKWHAARKGPVAKKFGRLVRYRIDLLEEYIHAQTENGNTDFAATSQAVNDALAVRAKERSRILTGASPVPTIYPFNKAAYEFLNRNDDEHRDKPQTALPTQTSFASLGAYFGNEPVQNTVSEEDRAKERKRKRTH